MDKMKLRSMFYSLKLHEKLKACYFSDDFDKVSKPLEEIGQADHPYIALWLIDVRYYAFLHQIEFRLQKP